MDLIPQHGYPPAVSAGENSQDAHIRAYISEMVAQQVQERIEVIERQYQQELAAREENWNNQVAEFQDRERAWLQRDKEAQARLLALQTELEVPKDQTHPMYFLTFFLFCPFF